MPPRAIELPDVLAPCVIGKQVEFAGPIGTEVNGVAHPARIGIVAALVRLGNLLDGMIRRSMNPDSRVHTAAIVFPLPRVVVKGRVGDGFAIGRVASLDAVGNCELCWLAAGNRYGEELLVHRGERLAQRVWIAGLVGIVALDGQLERLAAVAQLVREARALALAGERGIGFGEQRVAQLVEPRGGQLGATQHDRPRHVVARRGGGETERG